MAATITAAEAPAAVVLLGEDHIALGSVIKIAGLQRLGRKGSKARVGRRHGRMKLLAAKLPTASKLKGSCLAPRLQDSSFRQQSACCALRGGLEVRISYFDSRIQYLS